MSDKTALEQKQLEDLQEELRTNRENRERERIVACLQERQTSNLPDEEVLTTVQELQSYAKSSY